MEKAALARLIGKGGSVKLHQPEELTRMTGDRLPLAKLIATMLGPERETPGRSAGSPLHGSAVRDRSTTIGEK